jgi:hypothetical protein
LNGQFESISKNLLRSGRHVTILDAGGHPNKRLHAAAARNLCSRG